MATHDITTFGAVSGGPSAANTIAIQAAIDACGSGDILYVPNGTYTMGQGGINPWCVRFFNKSNITINFQSRASAIWAMDAALAATPSPGAGSNAPLVYLQDVDNLTFNNANLDGNKAGKGTSTVYDPLLEHHPGFFVWNAHFITWNNCYIHDMTGDGIQHYIDSTDGLFTGGETRWNQRDGITFSSTDLNFPVYRQEVAYSTLSCTVQAIDNEHGPAHDIHIHHTTLTSEDLHNTIAISGGGSATPSLRWHIHDCVINGSVFCVWGSDITMEDNTGTNLTGDANLELSRNSTNFIYRRCNIVCPSLDAGGLRSIIFLGGTPTSGPINFLIEDCDLTAGTNTLFGIRADGCVSGAVRNCDIVGTAVVSAGSAGVRVRSTVANRPTTGVIVDNNRISNWGQIAVYVVIDDTVVRVEVTRNTFFNTLPGGSMTIGVDLGPGILLSAKVAGNVNGLGIVTPLRNIPSGTLMSYTLSGGQPYVTGYA